MEQVRKEGWLFDVPSDTAVVTTKFVTSRQEAIRYVVHEQDPEEGIIWQFHCGNGDYSAEVLQLVSLAEILQLDPAIKSLAGLPVGYCARRSDASSDWIIAPDDEGTS